MAQIPLRNLRTGEVRHQSAGFANAFPNVWTKDVTLEPDTTEDVTDPAADTAPPTETNSPNEGKKEVRNARTR